MHALYTLHLFKKGKYSRTETFSKAIEETKFIDFLIQ